MHNVGSAAIGPEPCKPDSNDSLDVLFDMVGNRALPDCKRVLNAKGRYVPCSVGGGDWLGPVVRIIGGMFTFFFGSEHMRMFMQKLDAADLVVMRELIECGGGLP